MKVIMSWLCGPCLNLADMDWPDNGTIRIRNEGRCESCLLIKRDLGCFEVKSRLLNDLPDIYPTNKECGEIKAKRAARRQKIQAQADQVVADFKRAIA